MPLVALGIAAGVAGGAATAYGAKKSAEATTQASQVQAKSNADAIAEQQRQDAIQKQEFDSQQAAAKAQWDAQQAIRAPYRQAGSAALSSLGGILGVDFGSGGGGGGNTAPMGGGVQADPKLAAAIADYQQKNPGAVSIEPLTAALKQQGFKIDRFKYNGGVLSNNELDVNGQPYKVLGGEGTKAAYWYQPGMNDSAGGGSSAFMAPRSIAPSVLPMGNLPNALAPSYAPVVPITSLMGAMR